MKRLLLFTLCLLGYGATPAEAATEALTTAQLCNRASIVVIGTVSDVDSAWAQTGHGYIITSEVTFDVERVIHGSVGSTIGVHVNGGKVGDVRLTVGSTPSFKLDDRYLLLLHPRTGQPAMIIGQGAGAVRLDAAATLPSQSELVAEWEERCNA